MRNRKSLESIIDKVNICEDSNETNEDIQIHVQIKRPPSQCGSVVED